MSRPIEATYEEAADLEKEVGEERPALDRLGPQMARALEEIALSDPPIQIGDPVDWQREIRRDRRLPGRDD